MTGIETLGLAAMVVLSIPVGLVLASAVKALDAATGILDFGSDRYPVISLGPVAERVVAVILVIPLLAFNVLPFDSVRTHLLWEGETRQATATVLLKNSFDGEYDLFLRPDASWPGELETVRMWTPAGLVGFQAVPERTSEAHYESVAKGQLIPVEYVVGHPELISSDVGNRTPTHKALFFPITVWLLISLGVGALLQAAGRPRLVVVSEK